jgi:hypothetical protein
MFVVLRVLQSREKCPVYATTTTATVAEWLEGPGDIHIAVPGGEYAKELQRVE